MEEIIRNNTIPDWITLLILACLVLIALAKVVNTNRFNQFVQLFVTNKYFVVHGKSKEIFTRFNIFLLLVQLLAVSIFLFLLGVFFIEEIKLDHHIVYIQIVGFYTLFIGLKFYVEKIIGTLFSIEKYIDSYLYQKLSYRNLIALLLLVFNMILLYTTIPSTSILIAMVAIIVLFNIISLVYSYKVQEKLVRGQLFYFILYLCALEISPYFILYKILVG